jgi:transcription initiation factor TFIID subunit 5
MFNIPEVKLSHKIEYAKDYLDKKTIDELNEPNIQQVSFKNFNQVTCVETNLMGKVIVVGFSNGTIRSYYFFEESSKDFDLERAPIVQQSNLQTILETDINEVVDGVKECIFIGHSGMVTSLSVSYDSFYFISGSSDCTVRLWSLKMGQCLSVYKAHIKTVWSVKISPKGFHFASGGADAMIFLWLSNRSSFYTNKRHSANEFHPAS